MTEHELRMSSMLYLIRNELQAERDRLAQVAPAVDAEFAGDVRARMREIDARINEIEFAVMPQELVVDVVGATP